MLPCDTGHTQGDREDHQNERCEEGFEGRKGKHHHASVSALFLMALWTTALTFNEIIDP